MHSIKQGLAAAIRPVASSSTALRQSINPVAVRWNRLASSSSSTTPLDVAEPVELGGETSEVPDWPTNVSFEDGEDVVDQGLGAVGGARLHQTPLMNQEIFLPLSSLASTTPTQAAPENLAVALPSEIFAKPLRRDILHRCVTWELSLLRQGSGSTKDRSEVRASGRKLYRQKGTGRARVGDAASGIRRGGGVIHGPRPRDFALSLPRKVHALGLGTALSSKLSAGLLRVVPDLTEAEWKGTNEARRALCHAPAPESTQRFGTPTDISLLLLHSPFKAADKVHELERVTRNIPGVLVMDVSEAGVWELLKYKWVVLEADAVEALAAGLGTAWTALQDEGIALAEAEAEAESRAV